MCTGLLSQSGLDDKTKFKQISINNRVYKNGKTVKQNFWGDFVACFSIKIIKARYQKLILTNFQIFQTSNLHKTALPCMGVNSIEYSGSELAGIGTDY